MARAQLSAEARSDLRQLLAISPEDTTVSLLLHGEGDNRQLSFYVDGRRNETRIPYPDVEDV